MLLKYNINHFSEKQLIKDYIENGFVLVEDVISKSENIEITNELIKINRGDYECNEIKPTHQSLSGKSLMIRYMYI